MSARKHMQISLRLLLSLFMIAMLGGCADDEKTEAPGKVPEPPFVAVESAEVGSFILESDAGAAGLDIVAGDGRMLIEGLGAGAGESDTPTLAGFAVRDVDMAYEMRFGSFRPEDVENGPWIAADSLELLSNGTDARVLLYDELGEALATINISAPEDGHLKAEIEGATEGAKRLSWGYVCEADDHFMGFGAQTWDVDHRGFTVPTWVQEQGVGKVDHDEYDSSWMLMGRRHSVHVPIPQYLARRGYVMTAETDLRAAFALCSESEDAARVEIEVPASIHVFDGPSPGAAIERASFTFGRPRIPPSFAFAPWNDALYGSENVRRVSEKLREKGIPSSVIWTEDWKGAEWNGANYALSEEWELDRALYPDFEELADDLHSLGFKFLVYFNTFINKSTRAYEETAPKGYCIENDEGDPYIFIGNKLDDSSLLDLSNPDARAWARGKLEAAIALGADGWMGDFAEWMPTDAKTYAGSGLSQHNLHPVHWQELQREVLDNIGDGVDRLFFGRSGYLGTPELADVIWAGDQRTSFHEDDGMPTILPIGIGLGVVGISTYGHDIAGYQSVQGNEPSTKEVFFRWTSLGAWSPVMRTHHGYQAELNWNWEKDEETIEHFRNCAKLHIALAPYWEGLAKVANTTGMPIWRGLGIIFPEDEAAWPVKDQVMVGDRLLLAPVMVEAAVGRDVYLPAGAWRPWEQTDGETAPLSGKRTVHVDSAMDEIPVFALAGAVVPMYPDGVMTLANSSDEVPGPESVGDDRVVAVFLGDDGGFTEAGGLGYALEMAAGADLSSVGQMEFTWNGSVLGDCVGGTDSDCFESENEGRELVRVTGPGVLEVSKAGSKTAEFTVSGGAETRRLVLDLRH